MVENGNATSWINDARIERTDAKIDRVDAKFERKLEALSTRRFTLWVAVISAAATLAGAVLAVLFSAAHGHRSSHPFAFFLLARRFSPAGIG